MHRGRRFLPRVSVGVHRRLDCRVQPRADALDVVYEGTAQDPWGNTHVGFSAWTVIDREEWDLTWNAALEGGGWLVSKDVTIEIEGQLVRA